MKLSALLSALTERIPNAFSEEAIVSFINTAVRDLYKVLSPRDAYLFSAPGNLTLFPLPEDVTSALLHAVVVDGRERAVKRIGDTAEGAFWFHAADGFIGIYPAPRKGAAVTLVYSARPAPLLSQAEAEAAGKVYGDQEILLDEDFKELLLLSVCISISEAREDVALANNYKVSYNQLLSRAMQERYERDGKYPVTRRVQK